MTTTEDIWHELSCRLQRSILYHRARERFFSNWSNWGSFLSLLAGTSVVVAILAHAPTWAALLAGGLVAIVQSLEMVARLSERARLHNSLAAAFLAVERLVTLETNPTLQRHRELLGEALSIEGREPPIRRYLDLICHNQVAHAIGSDDLVRLRWYQRAFAQYLSGDAAMDQVQP